MLYLTFHFKIVEVCGLTVMLQRLNEGVWDGRNMEKWQIHRKF
jgi:hypothetical protein